MRSGALLQVLDQQRDDSPAGLTGLRRTLRREHRDRAAVALALDGNPVARQRRRVVALAEAEQAGEEALLGRGRLARIDVPDEVQALRTIAVLDGEAGAVERDAHAPP